MKCLRTAFTLIELLVVIAIIAILAAILFPVFAQAKVAAKKANDIANQKQIMTGTQIYLSDYDDRYPLAFPVFEDTFESFAYIYVPTDWDTFETPERQAAFAAAFPNNVMPYLKSTEIFKAPGGTRYPHPEAGASYDASPNKNLPQMGFNYNSTLQGYSSTAINNPAKLRFLTSAYGKHNFVGLFRPAPRLVCFGPGPCQYSPATEPCSEAFELPNGGVSQLNDPMETSMWVYGRGVNAVFADGHVAFQKVAQGATNRSDFRTDFWARYKANGVPRWSEWQDPMGCHTLLFRPDFDFENFGTPVRL